MTLAYEFMEDVLNDVKDATFQIGTRKSKQAESDRRSIAFENTYRPKAASTTNGTGKKTQGGVSPGASSESNSGPRC